MSFESSLYDDLEPEPLFKMFRKSEPIPMEPEVETPVIKDVEEEVPLPKAVNTGVAKMFIGGLNWETTRESLILHFSTFGEILECAVMTDPVSGNSRGFAFITFELASTLDKALLEEHVIDGKSVDAKRSIHRNEDDDMIAKLFVGGIPSDYDNAAIQKYFSNFGTILDVSLMLDRDTGRSRGFGFVTFADFDALEVALEAQKREPLKLGDKRIEVKYAMPRGKLGQGGPIALISPTIDKLSSPRDFNRNASRERQTNESVVSEFRNSRDKSQDERSSRRRSRSRESRPVRAYSKESRQRSRSRDVKRRNKSRERSRDNRATKDMRSTRDKSRSRSRSRQIRERRRSRSRESRKRSRSRDSRRRDRSRSRNPRKRSRSPIARRSRSRDTRRRSPIRSERKNVKLDRSRERPREHGRGRSTDRIKNNKSNFVDRSRSRTRSTSRDRKNRARSPERSRNRDSSPSKRREGSRRNSRDRESRKGSSSRDEKD